MLSQVNSLESIQCMCYKENAEDNFKTESLQNLFLPSSLLTGNGNNLSVPVPSS